jgi:cell wall-associated NlpC family hydrolase
MTYTPTRTQRINVVKRGLTCVGGPYREYSDGPVFRDCSSVPKYAWAPYLDLPHNSVEQAHYGPPIRYVDARFPIDGRWPLADLRYGDLVFYYDLAQPQHVALYVGRRRTTRHPLTLRRAVVNGTNEALGVELIGLAEYAHPVAYGFVGH